MKVTNKETLNGKVHNKVVHINTLDVIEGVNLTTENYADLSKIKYVYVCYYNEELVKLSYDRRTSDSMNAMLDTKAIYVYKGSDRLQELIAKYLVGAVNKDNKSINMISALDIITECISRGSNLYRLALEYTGDSESFTNTPAYLNLLQDYNQGIINHNIFNSEYNRLLKSYKSKLKGKEN